MLILEVRVRRMAQTALSLSRRPENTHPAGLQLATSNLGWKIFSRTWSILSPLFPRVNRFEIGQIISLNLYEYVICILILVSEF